VAVLQGRARRLTARARAAQSCHRFQAVFDGVFPHHRPLLASTELARMWNCGVSHIHNLIQDGLLPAGEKDYQREVFKIPREKVFEFMKNRRMK
jgi:hypothetical protein